MNLRNAFFWTRKSVLLLVATVFFGFASVFIVIGVASSAYLIAVNSSLPSYEEIQNRDVPESSKLYSRDGTLIYEFYGEYKRSKISLDQVSPHLKEATIAIEDKDFYNHGAISLPSIVRAMIANSKTGNIEQGGSTITQQFAKNALLDRKKLYSRKVREVLLAYKIESHFDKDAILELYLNEIPYGRNSYGAEAAAKTYFGKSASELNLTESAYLAALPQRPSYYSPTGANSGALEDRKNLVLQKMLEQGYITEQEKHQAETTAVAFLPNSQKLVAPYFVSWVQNYLTNKYGTEFLKEGGLKVYSALDMNLQNLAEQVVKEGAETNKTKYRAYNAALVAVDPSTNKVVAMAGGKDYFGAAEPSGCVIGKNCKFEPNVNVASSLRQPGSSFKPYAYLTAFKPEFGYTPLSKVLDAPTVFGTAGGRPYAPQNYDGGFRGLITIRKALAGSLNVPAVRTLAAVGVDNVVNTAKSLGITSPMKNCGLSLVLGGCEVKLVDHVTAFSVIANGGKGDLSSPFMRIEDKHGKTLEASSNNPAQVINPEAVYELISIMTDDQSRQYIFGKDNPLNLPDRPVAAKTGTTQNWKDGWTLGFTPQLAVGVWTGNNDSSLMRAGADGVFTAAPIWQKFMLAATASQPVRDFDVPAGIIQVAYDANTNRPVTGNAKNIRMEPVPWYALPKDIQVSAAPRNLQRSLIGPIDTKEVKLAPTGGQVGGAYTDIPSGS
ncbi:PBP1A family penicillin-binding protein [bacterium]|nr:MAG: PBP1A family penicillin-binding protein [bacterium]